MNNMQKAFKTKSSLRGMANGGEVFKNTVAGVPTFTDSRAATAGAKAYTPGQSGGTLSVIGQDPGTMAANAAAQKSIDARKAAAAPPPTLESALTSFFSNHSTTQAPATTPATTPATSSSLRARQNTPAPQTQLAQDFNAFFPAAPPAMPHSTAPVSQQVMEDFRTFFPAAADSTSTTDRLAMRSPGRDFHPYMAHGGKVKGPGGPTSDDVGPVMLSHGEYVLPADTVDIVGRDKLDALRLATHDFVDEDNKPRRKGLRGMANGGVLTREDLLLRPALQTSGGGALVPPSPPTGTAMVPSAPSGGGALTTTAPGNSSIGLRQPQTVYPRAVPAAQAAGKSALRHLGPAAVAGSAIYDAVTDSPAARQRAASGQEGLAGAASKVGSYLGSSLAAGVSSPQDIGSMISAARGEGTGAYHGVPDNEKGWARALGDKYLPTESASIMAGGVRLPPGMQERADKLTAAGFNLPGGMSEDDFARARALEPTATGGGGSTDVAMGNLRRGEAPGGGFVATNVPGIFGRKVAGDPQHLGEYVGVGAPARQEDPIMGEIRSALRGLTDGNSGQGGGFIGGSNSREINARYDKLAKQLSGMYSAKGQGNLARRLLELEQSRSNALDADTRNQSALRGQDMQASTAARMQALQTLGSMANQRSQQGAQAQAAQLKALQEAQAAARQGEEKGFERYTSAIGSMFVGPDGKPDAAEQERFTSFLQASDPQAQQKFAAMSPQDQMVLLQNFKTLYDMQKARNATAESGGGAITNRADMPADVREATWNDYWNNNLPLGDYVWSNMPFTNPNVVVTESGQPTLMSDYATTDGNWDADKLEMIRQRTGKDREGRSALRGN